jgi:hypothetical protein
MASRALCGAVSPRDLAASAYLAFATNDDLADQTHELAIPLINLAGDYEVADVLGNTDTEEIDAQVIAEARWIARCHTSGGSPV